MERSSDVLPRVFGAVAALVLPGALLLPACGGFDSELAFHRQPRLELHRWMTGEKEGRLVVLDRNGNLKEAGRILRSCEAGPASQEQEPLSGVCRDRIEYSYGAPALDRTVRWTMEYRDDFRASVRIIYEPGGELRGEAYGQALVLEGEQSIPGAPEERASSELRIYALPGADRPALQIAEYAWLGFTIGRAEVFWRDRNP